MSKYEIWIIKNRYFYITLVLLIFGIGVDLDANQNFRFFRNLMNDQSIPFETFTLEDYAKELNAHSESINREEKNTLKRKFQQAETFEKIGDLENAKKHYNSLLNGEDEHGNIKLINSFIVCNNIGVIHFKQKRNKNFESFTFMKNAFEISQNGNYKNLATINNYIRIIEANIDKLDNLVNSID